jgi:hypothetical protein
VKKQMALWTDKIGGRKRDVWIGLDWIDGGGMAIGWRWTFFPQHQMCGDMGEMNRIAV